MYDLGGMVALITGAAGKQGIGRNIALRLALEGANIVINDSSLTGIRFTEDDRLEGWQGLKDVEAEIKSMGRKVLVVEGDVSSSQQVEAMTARSIAKFGKIDVLINNAGIRGPNLSTLELSEEVWNRVLAVNLTGSYLCSKAVAKRMVEKGQGGKIINIASVAGKEGGALGSRVYAVSKFGIIGLTQVLAHDLAQYKINVNAVCPGFISTDLGYGATIRSDVRRGIDKEEAKRKAYSEILPQIPLGRIGDPADVASVVAFLASRESEYITGQAINICGGVLMAH